MKNKKEKLDKKDFISFLTNMTKEEIHQYLKDNGNRPKLIQMYRIIK